MRKSYAISGAAEETVFYGTMRAGRGNAADALADLRIFPGYFFNSDKIVMAEGKSDSGVGRN